MSEKIRIIDGKEFTVRNLDEEELTSDEAALQRKVGSSTINSSKDGQFARRRGSADRQKARTAYKVSLGSGDGDPSYEWRS